MPQITIKVNTSPLDRLAEDIERSKEQLLKDWVEEFANVLESRFLSEVRAITPFRTGKLRRSWRVIRDRSSGSLAVQIDQEFYMIFVMADEYYKLFNQRVPAYALVALDNVIKRYRV